MAVLLGKERGPSHLDPGRPSGGGITPNEKRGGKGGSDGNPPSSGRGKGVDHLLSHVAFRRIHQRGKKKKKRTRSIGPKLKRKKKRGGVWLVSCLKWCRCLEFGVGGWEERRRNNE